MTWFAFKGYNGGKAVDIAGSQEKEAVTLGFHGYGTEAQAEAKPNSVNLLNSWFVNAITADYHAAVAEQAQPGGANANILNPATAASAVATGAASTIPGVAQIGSFFSALAQGSTWIRVAEGLLGIILIAVGLARLTHAVPIATKIAGAVA